MSRQARPNALNQHGRSRALQHASKSELKCSSTLFHLQTASAQIAIGQTDTRKKHSLNTNGPAASAQQKEKVTLTTIVRLDSHMLTLKKSDK